MSAIIRQKNFLKLKPIHPLGTDGLYFPMLNIEYMADENNEKLPNHKEVYDRLKYLQKRTLKQKTLNFSWLNI